MLALWCAFTETAAIFIVMSCFNPFCMVWLFCILPVTFLLGATLGLINGIVLGIMIGYKSALFAHNDTEEQSPFPILRRRTRWAAVITTVAVSGLIIATEFLSRQEFGGSLAVLFGSPLIIGSAVWSAKKIGDWYPIMMPPFVSYAKQSAAEE